MSKPYFTKYLPVEGKGDIGCKWQWFNNVQNTGWEDVSQGNMDAIIAHGLEPQPKFRKLKLFLCSRDIQIGDKVKSFNYPEQYEGELVNLRTSKKLVGAKDHSEIYHLADIQYPNDSHCITAAISNFFKVIGEISSEAKWVKEGDEFYEDELRYVYTPEIKPSMCGVEPIPEREVIYIKGPCGHFH